MNYEGLMQSRDDVQRQARAWVRRLVSGQATEHDAREFRAWYQADPAHAQAFREARAAWRYLGEAGAAWRQEEETSAPSPRFNRRAVLAWIAGSTGVAATTMLAARPPMGLWPSMFELGADYRTSVGEQLSVSLPGDVRALLNTRTSLSVDGERIELIAGQVALQGRDAHRPVEIRAGAGTIALSRADIELRLLTNHVCLSCTRGRVRLRHAAGLMEVQENQKVYYDHRGAHSPDRVDPVEVAAWRSGILLFRKTPVSEVVDEINRYRPGKVILLDKSLGQRQLSGRFAIDQLDVALEQIERVLDIRLRRLAAGVVLIG